MRDALLPSTRRGLLAAGGVAGAGLLAARDADATHTPAPAPVNVLDHHAVGNNAQADTAGFKSAIQQAVAEHRPLYIPDPPGGEVSYLINETLEIKGTGQQCFMDIRGNGRFDQIRWVGNADTPVFRSLGWKRSMVEGVRIRSDKDGVIGWDIDGHETNHPSTGQLGFRDCHVTAPTTVSRVIGWRLGNTAAGTDISFIDFVNCFAHFGGPERKGHIGWLNLGTNSLNHTWLGCSTYWCDVGWSNRLGSGADDRIGNDSMYFYGCGTSGNGLDFEFAVPGAYLISGGRFENGERFLRTGRSNSASRNLHAVSVAGVRIASYGPTTGRLFDLATASCLSLEGVVVHKTTWPATMIVGSTASNGFGSIIARGCAFQAADPFFTVSPATSWHVDVKGCVQLSTNESTGAMLNRPLP
jgi:hypothetical protein